MSDHPLDSARKLSSEEAASLSEPDTKVVESVSASTQQRLKRLGCIGCLIIWFLILLLPCGLIALAVRGEIVISQGEAPEQDLRIWLIMEIGERGIGVSTTSPFPGANNEEICIQTDVSYYLWEGQADPVSYCQCYQADNWEPTRFAQGICAS